MRCEHILITLFVPWINDYIFSLGLILRVGKLAAFDWRILFSPLSFKMIVRFRKILKLI